MTITHPEMDRALNFFQNVSGETPDPPTARSIVITHLLRDRPPFLAGIDKVAPVSVLLPKPKSVDSAARARVRSDLVIRELRRSHLQEDGAAVRLIGEAISVEPFVILDVGGYFAPLVSTISDAFGSRFLGVVEDTENGLQKYMEQRRHPVPVFSVARSPLKNAEDYLVGQSIVFSLESLLRSYGAIFQGRRATVIGFGKVGRSIASLLHTRRVSTTVFDINPVRMTEAMSHGFDVAPTIERALVDADLILCATGHLSLSGSAFDGIRSGAFVATVTSSDDELDLRALRSSYREHRLDNHLTKFSRYTALLLTQQRERS